MRKLLPFSFLLATASAVTAASISFSNPGFEDQTDVLDGNHNGIPVASDPGDFIQPGLVPGWGFRQDGVNSTVVHSTVANAFAGNAVLSMSDLTRAIYQPLHLVGGAPIVASPGDVITISGWGFVIPGDDDNYDTLGLRLDVLFDPNTPWGGDVSDDLTIPFTPARLADSINVRMDGKSADDDEALDPAWAHWSATFTVPDAATLIDRYGIGGDQSLGKPIVLMFNAGYEDSFLTDEFSGTFTTAAAEVDSVPEPGALMLASLSLVGFLARIRR